MGKDLFWPRKVGLRVGPRKVGLRAQGSSTIDVDWEKLYRNREMHLLNFSDPVQSTT